nr:MAG: ORF1 [TTV-like mini virus]
MPWWYNARYRYRRNFYRPYKRRWTRKRIRPRRFRRPLRRRIYRRRPYRVRKRLFYKKKTILIRQWQPSKINKCKIKGLMCLFQCGPDRISNNWTQYMNSFVPEHWHGGGGWSQLKFSLGSLFEERQLVRNYWTKSNVALPLVRYGGCKLKFYRTQYVDYIVHYTKCYPMLDTSEQHTNAQPSAMLMYRKKIIVPSFTTEPHNKKPYKKKFISPPSQMYNKWYFQQDICNTGLLMLTTTACNLDRFYLSPLALSNNITITCLNTVVFQNRNFQQTDINHTTTPWSPKANYYMYGANIHNPSDIKFKDLIYLGQTQYNHEGIAIGTNDQWQTYSSNPKWKDNFGNPLNHTYLTGTYHILIGGATADPQTIFNKSTNPRDNKVGTKLTLMGQDLIKKCRYNPNKDTGLGNEIYFLKNTRNETGWDAPNQNSLLLRGYPLWLAWWGWPDWQKKLAQIQQIDYNYIAVFKTECIDEKLPGYVPLDMNFIEGKSPYELELEHALPSDYQHWYPRFKYQFQSINDICKTGPGTVKLSTKSVEAHMMYTFYFKWGGCPNELENIADPCNQPKYPVPNNFIQGTEIQNPISSPTKELYQFDFRRYMLTNKAAKRITENSISETTSITDGNKWNASPNKETTSEEESEEGLQEETEELQLQLKHLKQQQLRYRNRIFKLMKQAPTLKYINQP